MGKKKDAVGLFEVMSKTKEKQRQSGLGVPVWMDTRNHAPDEPPPPPPPAPAASAAQPVRVARPPEPMVSRLNGRVHLSLNYVSLAVVGISLLVLLIGAFYLGRATVTAGTNPAATAEMGDQPPLKKGIVPPKKIEKKTTTPPVPAKREIGKYYLVIQNLRGSSAAHKDEAFRIVDFCKNAGEPADVRTLRGNFIVWSLRPMDSDRSEAAKEFARHIEALGKEYFDRYKTHDFRQRKTKTGPFDPMYIRKKADGS